MKNFQALKILFLLLLMVSFTTQTTKATTDIDTPVYLNDGYEGLIRDLYCDISRATLSQSDCIEGKCFLTFVTTKEGAVDAAKEAIKHLVKFKPGRRFNSKEQKWEPLRVHYNISVVFPYPPRIFNIGIELNHVLYGIQQGVSTIH